LETEKVRYQIVVTKPAEIHFYEILEYLYAHYSPDRASEVADSLREKVSVLSLEPERGTIEPRLLGRKYQYRFILFRRQRMKDIKIVYFIDEERKTVFVTDFFPTEMDDRKVPNRN
jgi:plasmid stabilization system protein ParE